MKEKRRILLCEDEMVTALNIKGFLEKRGYELYFPITSGRELINAATHYFPSLIISDITLEGDLDGIEAISRISELIKIPYIFITGHSEYVPLMDTYFLHPLNVFIKPIDLNDLYSSIKNYFEHLHSKRPNSNYLG